MELCIIRFMNARLLAIKKILLLVISGSGYNPERDKDCPGCDLSRADLNGADLTGADLRDADLRDADLERANLAGAEHLNLIRAIRQIADR